MDFWGVGMGRGWGGGFVDQGLYEPCSWSLSMMLLIAPQCHLSSEVSVFQPPRERKIPGSNPACDRIFGGSSHTSDSKIGTPVATLPGAWRHRVSAGTGQPSVSIL